MKVKLIKEATYELNDNKCSSIPYDTFLKMASVDENQVLKFDGLRSVRIFESIDEFRTQYSEGLFDSSENVRVLKDGRFCVFLNTKTVEVENPKIKNGTTDTKENTGEEA